MLSQYLHAAMRNASYEILEDGSYFGRIPDCQGVWANENTLEACREELESALEDWLFYRISKGLELPVIDGLDLTVRDSEHAEAN